jgi:flagellar hook-length control protein FliK
MQSTIDSLHTTITLLSRQGVSQARIQLAPASLGSIQIQLQRTEAGLVAKVVADRAETAHVLQQNSGELRRSLEATGQPLLRLDISASGQRELPGRPGQSGGETSRARPADDPTPTSGPAAATPAPALQSTLVNVLA